MSLNDNNQNDVAVPIVNNNDNNEVFENPDAPLPDYDDNSVILQDFTPLEPLDYQREDIDRTAETTSNDTNAVKTDPKQQRKRDRNKIDAENSAKRRNDKYNQARREKELLEQEVEALVANNQNMEEQLRNGVWLYVSHHKRATYSQVNRQLVDDNLKVFHQEKRQNYMDSEARRARDTDLMEKRELENLAQLAASDAYEDNHVGKEMLDDLLHVLSEPNKDPIKKGTLASRQTRKRDEHEYASNVFHIAWNEHEKRKQEQQSIILNSAWAYYRPPLQDILNEFGDEYRQKAANNNRLLEFERMCALIFPTAQ
ncbi:hypothetical protein CAEBREN_08088 [Caenorhabditis brenneri]|uniref:Uncharacterized protein n=1 Tax=Caenorhabditis brenneri TaxID=135651 RepID=G0PDK4_CAEBE|nr:hypothetical protein CAEBREN_08088 [Caenorhabditis brenneri]